MPADACVISMHVHAVYSRRVDDTVLINGCILEHVSTEMADASEGFVSEFSSADEGSDRESEGTDDSDSTRAPGPKRKYRGSALYNTKYDRAWRDSYPCVQAVENDPYSFLCTTCNKVVSCNHMGISDVKRHGMYKGSITKSYRSSWTLNRSSHLFQAAVQQQKRCVDACITVCVCVWLVHLQSISPGSTC